MLTVKTNEISNMFVYRFTLYRFLIVSVSCIWMKINSFLNSAAYLRNRTYRLQSEKWTQARLTPGEYRWVSTWLQSFGWVGCCLVVGYLEYSTRTLCAYVSVTRTICVTRPFCVTMFTRTMFTKTLNGVCVECLRTNVSYTKKVGTVWNSSEVREQRLRNLCFVDGRVDWKDGFL